MLDPELRLWAESWSEDFLPWRRGQCITWHIIDFEQRRHFAVQYEPASATNDIDPDDTEDVCVAQLRKHVDRLDPGVFGIRFTDPDGSVYFLTDQEVDDVTYHINSHPLPALGLSFPVKTVFLSSLKELDRLEPEVDLVSYPGTPGRTPTTTTAVFKYWLIKNGMSTTWCELNAWSRLPRDHPHIVPFDSVVLDHNTGVVVGFTALHVPGGTLRENNATKRPFRLSWLLQLIAVVDDLNYQYGIMHQDIAPRNLVIDGEGNLRISDFSFATMIGGKHCNPDRDDLKGVILTLYEIVTLDEHFRKAPRALQDAEAVPKMKWVKHPDVQLDADLDVFRGVLNEWARERKAKKTFSPRDTWVQWPEMREPPLVPVPIFDRKGKMIGSERKSPRILYRRHLVALDERPFWNWERPASYNLREFPVSKQPSQKEIPRRRTRMVEDGDTIHIIRGY